MKDVRINGIISFILFLEEWFFWKPGRVNTIIEKVLFSAGRSFFSTRDLEILLYFVNPALLILLFLGSVTAIVNLAKSFFSETAKAELIIWVARHSYIKVILAVIVAVFVIFGVLRSVVDASDFSLMNLYFNKSFWGVMFAVITVNRFLKE